MAYKILFILISYLLLKPISGYAQNYTATSSIGISPVIIEEVIKPNTIKKTYVYVYNLTTENLPIKATVKPLIKKEDVEPENQGIFDSTKWFYIKEKEFILKPQEQKKVEIVIKAPDKAGPGSHFATIIFEPLILKTKPHNSLVMSSKIGVQTLLLVPGEIIEKASVVNFYIDRVNNRNPTEFSFDFENKGNAHLLPKGRIEIFNLLDKKVFEISTPTMVSLPYTTKNVIVPAAINKFMFGRYRAEIQMHFGTANYSTENVSVYFWVLPIFNLLLILLLTLIVIFITIKHRKVLIVLKILFGKHS